MILGTVRANGAHLSFCAAREWNQVKLVPPVRVAGVAPRPPVPRKRHSKVLSREMGYGGLWERRSPARAGLSCRSATTPTWKKVRCARANGVRKRNLYIQFLSGNLAALWINSGVSSRCPSGSPFVSDRPYLCGCWAGSGIPRRTRATRIGNPHPDRADLVCGGFSSRAAHKDGLPFCWFKAASQRGPSPFSVRVCHDGWRSCSIDPFLSSEAAR